MAEAGELLGLLHDLGKYSSEFQSYLRSASGQIDPDEDGYVDAEELKGKVDHSSAGAQLVWNALKDRGPRSRFVGQALALCIASHHSGLIDCVSPKDEAKAPNNFERRMLKAEAKTHLSEARSKAEQTILDRIHALVGGERMTEEVLAHFQRVVKHEQARRGYQTNAPALPFQFGLVVKILFSCLVDADRLDTADFENQRTARHRQHGSYADWDLLIARLERKLAEFDSESPVGAAR
jgi:CRISPR-associated endonuclease/helicase Cas3